MSRALFKTAVVDDLRRRGLRLELLPALEDMIADDLLVLCLKLFLGTERRVIPEDRVEEGACVELGEGAGGEVTGEEEVLTQVEGEIAQRGRDRGVGEWVGRVVEAGGDDGELKAGRGSRGRGLHGRTAADRVDGREKEYNGKLSVPRSNKEFGKATSDGAV